jgi:ketosteroid isomerase-like protein
VILDDADLEATAATIARAECMISGQVCASLTRLIVTRNRHDEFVDALAATFSQVRVGDPFDERLHARLPVPCLWPLTPPPTSWQNMDVTAFPPTSNEDLARTIIAGISAGKIDADLLHPAFHAWTNASGDFARDAYLGALRRFATLFDKPLIIEITGVTDGGDRVAVEATSQGSLPSGQIYRNTYHFLLRFDAGQLREIREYLDPRQLDAIRPLLAN